MNSLKAFTLIELLIVIAIIAILGSATVLVLNPVEIIKQGRDGTRITDVENIQKSLNLTLFNNPSLVDSLLSTNIYLSLPSGSCPLSPPTGYTYVCNATSANINKTDGTGWIPLTLQNMASLPTDPNSNFYYAFIANPTTKTFTVTALLESEKQTKLSAAKDGGTDPGRFEKGDTGLWSGASGLVGYWPMDEGSGGIAYDSSGNNNNGTWNGTGTHYDVGKVGSYAGKFNGSATSDYINITSSASLALPGTGDESISLWIKHNGSTYLLAASSWEYRLFQSSWLTVDTLNNYHYLNFPSISDNNWHFLTYIKSGNTISLYRDGIKTGEIALPANPRAIDGTWWFGQACSGSCGGLFYTGLLDDIKMFKRALTADEILSMYNAHK